MKRKHRLFLNYLILTLGFLVGFLALFANRLNQSREFFIVVLLALFYVVWGVVLHVTNKDFSLKVFLEYVLISALALVLGFFIFLR